MKKAFLAIMIVAFAMGAATNATAQTPTSESDSLLPTGPDQWINAPPLTSEMLEGKGVFLWFFSEDCPRCRAKWPELTAISEQLADQPVIFIAVNSGNSPADVASYAKSVGLRWPVLADISRQFEKKVGVGEISLQNIWQAAIITPKGEIHRVSVNDIEGAVRRAAVGASWQVDPSKITSDLRPAWRAIELGVYEAGARDIMKHRESSNATNKQAAEALYAVVEKDMLAASAEAWDLGQENKFYQAYVAMSQVKERFKGYDVPKKLDDAHSWLAKKEEVRDEIEATKVLENARGWLGSTRAAVRNRGITALQNVVTRFPETNAAKEAQAMLDQADAP